MSVDGTSVPICRGLVRLLAEAERPLRGVWLAGRSPEAPVMTSLPLGEREVQVGLGDVQRGGGCVRPFGGARRWWPRGRVAQLVATCLRGPEAGKA